MIKVTDVNGQAALEVSFITDEPFLLFENKAIEVECCLLNAGIRISVTTLFNRSDLEHFALSLMAMHRDLTPGTSTTLWSTKGNVAIRVLMVDRGAVAINCILSDVNRPATDAGFARISIDQTFLTQLARQTLELSKSSTPWSN